MAGFPARRYGGDKGLEKGDSGVLIFPLSLKERRDILLKAQAPATTRDPPPGRAVMDGNHCNNGRPESGD